MYTLRSGVTFVSFFTLDTLRSGVAFVALFALYTLRSGITFVSFFTLDTLRSGITFVSFFALYTLRSGVAFITFFALYTLRSGRLHSGRIPRKPIVYRDFPFICQRIYTGFRGNSISTFFTLHSLCSGITFISLFALHALRSCCINIRRCPCCAVIRGNLPFICRSIDSDLRRDPVLSVNVFECIHRRISKSNGH